MTPGAPPLSLADLEAYDPHAPQNGRNRRFACPLCGDGKPRDAAHRSMSANTETGAWFCWRCRAAGKLQEHWTDRPATSSRARARSQLARACALPPAAPTATPTPDKARELRAQLQDLKPLAGTPGAAYLSGRGLEVDVCHAAGARLSPDFYGRPAVVFPLRNRDGALVAAQGRYLDRRDNPKARTLGEKKLGVFAVPAAWELPAVIVTEAPLDALSLAVAGYPALALCGTTGPAWLPKACAFRRVLLAFDADDAGDRAAAELAPTLRSFGARCERLRPEGFPFGEGGKDWNEWLQGQGRDALADTLALRVLVENSAAH